MTGYGENQCIDRNINRLGKKDALWYVLGVNSYANPHIGCNLMNSISSKQSRERSAFCKTLLLFNNLSSLAWSKTPTSRIWTPSAGCSTPLTKLYLLGHWPRFQLVYRQQLFLHQSPFWLFTLTSSQCTVVSSALCHTIALVDAINTIDRVKNISSAKSQRRNKTQNQYLQRVRSSPCNSATVLRPYRPV